MLEPSTSVSEVQVAATVLASMRRQVSWPQLSVAIRELFDQIYAFLRDGSVEKTGHNVCIYHAPTSQGAELEAGVQVAGPFEGAGAIVSSTTPSGRAAWAVHLGPYDQLGRTHDAIGAWCRARKLSPGLRWEVYGDWTDDPRELRTDVYWLVEP